MNCHGIEVKYSVKKALPKMVLFAEKTETSVFEIYSPVFDIQNVTLPVPGKLAGQVDLQMQSFFLVFDSPERQKLKWVPVGDCTIVMHPYRGI